MVQILCWGIIGKLSVKKTRNEVETSPQTIFRCTPASSSLVILLVERLGKVDQGGELLRRLLNLHRSSLGFIC